MTISVPPPPASVAPPPGMRAIDVFLRYLKAP